MEIVNVKTTPTELPVGEASTLTVQNQSLLGAAIRVVIASDTPGLTAAGAIVPPLGWYTTPSLADGEEVWAWIIGNSMADSKTPVLVIQNS